jgi:hypothetical protein
LGIVYVNINNVRVGLNLGVKVQYAIAIDGFIQIYFTVNFMIAGTYLAFSLSYLLYSTTTKMYVHSNKPKTKIDILLQPHTIYSNPTSSHSTSFHSY